jgi:hypothetical protein
VRVVIAGVYFFRLFICGGLERAPALPQSADNPPAVGRTLVSPCAS